MAMPRFLGIVASLLPGAAALSGSQCSETLKWFDRIDEQATDLTPERFSKKDRLFDASASSIAEAGANCGDTAAGQKEDCSDYNNWDTMQKIAENRELEFAVFKDDPKLKDVNQGGLGDCYFLAALASVASARPAFIADMFTHQDEWETGVYTTKWKLGGGDVEVAVNNKVPVGKDSYYTAFAHGGEDAGTLVFWPVILEKAWAKIFQTYKAMEGGVWGQVIASISSANVLSASHKHVKDPEHVWGLLKTGTESHYPMGAGTSDKSNAKAYGLVEGHQYTVIKTTEYDGARAVECFNPWSEDHYKGAVPNEDEADGKFTMTFDEYMDAFSVTEVAEMKEGYRSISKTVEGTNGVMEGLFEFTVAGDDPFTVGVHWPSQHLFPEGCEVPDPQVTLVVAKKDDYTDITLGNENGRKYGINAARAEVKSGPGTYIAFFNAKFKDNTWIPSVHLTVYAGEEVQIAKSGEAQDMVVKAMLMPDCDDEDLTVTVPEAEWCGLFHLANAELIGVPYYVSSDHATYLFFDGDRGEWTFIGERHWEEVKAGSHFVTSGYGRAKLGQCGVHDSQELGGFPGTTCADIVAKKFNNMQCEDSEYTDAVLRFCPESCEEMKEAANKLKDHPEHVMPACEEVTLKGRGRFKDGLFIQKPEQKFGDVPTYVSLDERTVMYYKEGCAAWSLIGMGQWQEVLDGANFATACFAKDDPSVHCGRHDAEQIGPYGDGCDVVRAHTYSNVNCQDVAVQRYCAETCDSSIEAFDVSVPQILGGARGSGARLPMVGNLQLGAAVLLVALAAIALATRTTRRHGHVPLAGGSAEAQTATPMLEEELQEC